MRFRGPHVVLGIDSGLAMWKASALSAYSLVPLLFLFFLKLRKLLDHKGNTKLLVIRFQSNSVATPIPPPVYISHLQWPQSPLSPP